MAEKELFRGIGSRIKNLRKQAKLTQSELAEKAGIYRTDLSALENGVDKIKSVEILNRIVEATGHEMKDLFTEILPFS